MFSIPRICLFGILIFITLSRISSFNLVQAQEKSTMCPGGFYDKLKPLVLDISGIPVFFYLEGKNRQSDKLQTSTAQIVSLVAIRLYRKLISPYLGVRCNFYPSCSEFGFQSYKKYGFLIGTLMTADRLSRDHCFIRLGEYPLNEEGHYLDPVENNYIFKKKKK